MEKVIIDALSFGGPALVTGWIGFYLGAYLKKKGENLATHEDMDKLVDQVAEVTQTTKQIEAKISDEVWDRQKRWELKREVLFEAIRALAGIENALVGLHSVTQVEKQPNNVIWATAKHDKTLEWTRVYSVLRKQLFWPPRYVARKQDKRSKITAASCLVLHSESHGMMMVRFIRNLRWSATRNAWSFRMLFARN